MPTQNRPYVFELAEELYRAESAGDDQVRLRDTASANAVDREELDRAVEVIRRLHATGIDVDEWVRQEYVMDGWLRGYLALDASLEAASTWRLAQAAAAFYSTVSTG
ncbi:hypothetical protein [Mycobacteroides abscessus]|uniref:hypothetical protein n=1 Tax=Mycobacteroides abscessus TaxID=36809 RepID=UPI0021056A9C|nr:hypothetical protein [Mycobacteroides abscessus]